MSSSPDSEYSHPPCAETKTTLALYFHWPLKKVATKVGVCTTTLKKICRDLGLGRWPHRKLCSLDRQITQFENSPRSLTDGITAMKYDLLKLERSSILKVANDTNDHFWQAVKKIISSKASPERMIGDTPVRLAITDSSSSSGLHDLLPASSVPSRNAGARSQGFELPAMTVPNPSTQYPRHASSSSSSSAQTSTTHSHSNQSTTTFAAPNPPTFTAPTTSRSSAEALHAQISMSRAALHNTTGTKRNLSVKMPAGNNLPCPAPSPSDFLIVRSTRSPRRSPRLAQLESGLPSIQELTAYGRS